MWIGDLAGDRSCSWAIVDWHCACPIVWHDTRRPEGANQKFAVDVIRFAKTIPKDPSTMRSRADFIHKLSGAVEEVDESALWLEILTEADISPRNQTKPLWIEADELTRILVRSRETARARRDRRS